MRPFLRTLLAAGIPVLAGIAPAQDEQPDASQAIEKWLASDQTSDELMASTVAAVLAEPKVGLKVLGGLARELTDPPRGARMKGLASLCVQVTLEHLRRTHKSGMVFVGQYDDLKLLQPFAGRFLLDLLLDTPNWYPLTFRVRLVPAIRDLVTRLPGAGVVEAIVACVEDEGESIHLRRALAAMLWQWGEKQHAEAFVGDLVRATTEGDGEDRIQATLQLADYYYLMRDYARAAGAHRSAQALARDSEIQLRPIAWYSAACVHALRGDTERGMAALTTCAQMLSSPDLDSSWRLERKLFEKDPEIAVLRKDERFEGLVERAFGHLERGEKDKQGK